MKNSKLIEALNNCVTHCNYCADACLDEGDIKMMVDCIRTDRACAEICRATANLLASNYKDVRSMVEQCRDICKNVLMYVLSTTINIVKNVQTPVENVRKLVRNI